MAHSLGSAPLIKREDMTSPVGTVRAAELEEKFVRARCSQKVAEKASWESRRAEGRGR